MALDHEPYLCPPDTEALEHVEARGALSNVNLCIDIPRDCRQGDRFSGCVERADLGTPACGLSMGHRRIGCVDVVEGVDDEIAATAAQAREKLFRQCAIYGALEAPHGESGPERYCFTSCVDPLRDEPEREQRFACDADLFDPPEITHTSFLWHLTPSSGSSAQLDVDVEGDHDTATIALRGEVALDAPGCGPMMACEVVLPWVRLRAGDFTVYGQVVHGATAFNPEPLSGATVAADSATLSRFEIPAGAQLYVSGELVGHGEQGRAYTTLAPLTGELHWDTRQFAVRGRFVDPSGTSTLRLDLRGAFPNLPPVADAGPDQRVECTDPEATPVTLSASRSHDPDLGAGQQDIRSYAWWLAGPNTRSPQGHGLTFAPRLRLGTHRYQLTVRDSRAAMGFDHVTVEVVDTTGPEVEVSAGCLVPDGEMHLVELGDGVEVEAADACTTSPITTRIVGVRSDDSRVGPADARYDDRGVCLRAAAGRLVPRLYTLTLESVDPEGNTTETEVVVDVPYPTNPRTGASSCAEPMASTRAGEAECPPIREVEPPPTRGSDFCGCRIGPASPVAAGGLLLALLLLVWRRRSRG